MEPITHVYVYGDIVNYQAEDVQYWGCVSLTVIKNAVEANPEAEEVIVHIHSCGGSVYEAFAIYDYLKSCGKKITTIVEGICASSATIVLLAGSVRQLTSNCEFLIHNPWTWADGNADELEEVAAQLRIDQKRILDFYVKITGSDAVALQTLMDEDKWITPEEAISLKFATEILNTVDAMAKIKNNVHQKQIFNSIKKQMDKSKKTKLEGFIASGQKLLKDIFGTEETAPEAATANSITLDDGTYMYFAEDAIAEGIDVFSDEAMTTAMPDNDYTAESGDVITVKDGAVESITPAASGQTDAEALAAVKAELVTAKADLKAANKRADEAEALAESIGETLDKANTSLSQVVSSGWKPKARAAEPAKPGKVVTGKAVETNDLKAGVAAEKQRRKEAEAKKNSK